MTNTQFRGRSQAVKTRAMNALKSGQTVAKVARSVGVTEQTIYRWKREALDPEPLALVDDEMGGEVHVPLEGDDDGEEASDWTGQAFGGMTPEGAVTVSVLRENDRVAGTWAWCEDVAAQSFNLTTVRQKWGPGSYRFLVRDRSGKTVETRNLTVAAAPAEVTTPQAPLPNGGVSNLMDQVMHAMLLRALDPPSVWDKVAQAMPILAPVIGQVLSSRTPSADPVQIATAITNAASAMRGAGPSGGNGETASEMIRTFRDGLSLGQTLSSDREPGMVDVVKELGPGFLQVLGQKNGQPPVVQVPRPNGNGARALANPPAVQPQPPVSPMWAALLPSLDALAPIIIDGAQRSEPVQDLAERIYAATPAYMQSVIEHASNVPGAVDVIVARYPALAQQKEYVTSLLVELGKPAPAEDVVE